MLLDVSISISNSVGRGGRNTPQDVIVIQRRLNALAGATRTALSLDGKSGPLTEGAIEDFQKVVLGFSRPDKRVDVGGKTIAALNDPAAARTWQGSVQSFAPPPAAAPKKGLGAPAPVAKPALPAAAPKPPAAAAPGPRAAAPDSPAGEPKDPSVVASGARALQMAEDIAEIADPVFGIAAGPVGTTVKIPVGTYDARSKRLVIGQLESVFYLQGNDLRRSGRQTFVNAYEHAGIVRDIRDQTKWIVPIAETMAYAGLALAGAMAGTVIAATITVTTLAVKCGVFYDGNKRVCDIAIEALPLMKKPALWLARECPTYWEAILRVMGHALWEAVKQVPDGRMTPKSAGKTLGKLIGALAKGPSGAVEPGLGFVVKTLLKTLAGCVPGFAINGVGANAKATANDIVAGFRAAGVTVGMSQAEIMAQELSKPGALQRVDELRKGAEALEGVAAALVEGYAAAKPGL